MKCRTPEAAEGPPGTLFVFKTPISAKKIQKHEILLCKKSLFSLHKQNKEIPYKKSWFATVYKGNIIKNLIMDCQSYTKYRPKIGRASCRERV